ncbi:Vinorine synthase [Morella rubra]|uniref:Vinorine synthase n=1 Tax=Morella rubra TaxID=262757 RepID=A0A6A1WJS6_9ROSI|nr:Vinorine synthase [Morella rubra]
MLMTEVDIISREIVRPSSPAVLHFKPFKLTLLDQLTPTTYVPLVLFYPKSHTHQSKGLHILPAQLKKSLSKTLDHYYPFSGRTQRNLFVDHYDEGVPYNEARVKCRMNDFLQHPDQTVALNQFLPCWPFILEPNPEETPQVAIQVNIFDCGGIAIGMCFSHKITDGITMSAFLKSWAVNAAGHCNKLELPDFSGASSSARFPPQDSTFVPIHLSLVESFWFGKGKYKTRRFVMDSKSIETLKAKARSERVVKPTRVESLSGFIFARAVAASRVISGSPRPAVLAQAVNIRGRTKPCLPDYSPGNIFRLAFCECNSVENQIELSGIVAALREAVEKISGQSFNIADQMGLFSKADTFCFSSWLKFGFDELDFGWGRPIWVGVMLGDVGPREVTFFTKTNGLDAIEAWVTLKEKEMAVLEDDPEFLAFASKNPSILS